MIQSKTPLIELINFNLENGNRLFAKLENQNPLSHSHYDRVYKYLFDQLITQGKIVPNETHLIETSSGNAGTSFSNYCKLYGFKGTVIFPKSVNKRRIQSIPTSHVNVIVSKEEGYMSGVNIELRRMMDSLKKQGQPFWVINHSQTWNSVISLKPIGTEIAHEFLSYSIKPDFFISALGNGSSTSAIGLELKDYFPKLKVFGFEPKESPTFTTLIYTGKPLTNGKEHQLTGTGVWNIPFPNISTSIIDDVILVDGNSRKLLTKYIMQTYQDLSISIGYTSASSIMIAEKLSSKYKNKNFVIVFYDIAEFYDTLYKKINLLKKRLHETSH